MPMACLSDSRDPQNHRITTPPPPGSGATEDSGVPQETPVLETYGKQILTKHWAPGLIYNVKADGSTQFVYVWVEDLVDKAY
ncbi:hypothetical protein TRICI_001223 [Trichomonascus ciferrii]|uniref:Uncharacterized protein n=1 Tax=Trichomonascus ciferrii TaxID=44093 RepID=A0A642VAH5_9ASCO|nr:hypothetical protein TRICI_001223 [Trichomonascus ciferrii]